MQATQSIPYPEQLVAQTHLAMELHFALSHLNRATELFPRKHRLNPDDADHPSAFADGSYQLLATAGEAIIAAMEINQRAIPIPEDHACLPYASEPLRQAASEAMARATQRRLDNERDALIRLGMEAPETPPRTAADESAPNPQTTGNDQSGDCHPPSAKSEH